MTVVYRFIAWAGGIRDRRDLIWRKAAESLLPPARTVVKNSLMLRDLSTRTEQALDAGPGEVVQARFAPGETLELQVLP